MPEINAQTNLFGVLAGNSRSSGIYPMYNAGFTAADYNGVYLPVDTEHGLKHAIESLVRLGFKGAGIGAPYKQDIIKYLDDLEGGARRIGAVNYILIKEGKIIGGNTDGQGALMALKEKIALQDKKIILIGAGGMARAIAFALADIGLQLRITNRTLEKAQELASLTGNNSFPMNKLSIELTNADVIINATTLGMVGDLEKFSPIPNELLRSDLIIQEVVSVPRETTLVLDAIEKGCEIVPARRTSLWQAVQKFYHFTGIRPSERIIASMEDAFH